MNWEERDKNVLWHPFTSMKEWGEEKQLVVERGEGNYLIGSDGRRYFDGVSSLWVTIHGHAHPAIADAIARQASVLDHSTLLGLTHPLAIKLAEELVRLAPPGLRRVFYSDSGSTAVEIALKQAFQYWSHRGKPGKQRFLHLSEAYHGDTLGAVGVGGIQLFHRIFGPLIVAGIPVPSPGDPHVRGVSERDPAKRAREALAVLDRILAERSEEIAAFVIEPLVQGAAGMLVHPPGFLADVASRCRDADVLLVVDEVATGFGRTGTLFACEQEAVRPDFLCVAKGLTGGSLPLAATLSTEEVFEAFVAPRAEGRTFFHGHTYTGNPIACAAALATLEVFATERTLDHVARMVGWIAEELSTIAKIPGVKEVRQRGAMVGIELEPTIEIGSLGRAICEDIRSRGIILRPLGDVVVWMPPLSSTEDEIRMLGQATASSIRSLTNPS